MDQGYLVPSSWEPTSHIYQLPNELIQYIVWQLVQDDLVNLARTSKLFYKMATRILYSKIYLNDSPIEKSDVCILAPTWSWLKLAPRSSTDESKNDANIQLKRLLRSIEGNPHLANNIQEVRLNWDLDAKTQKAFVSLITRNSQSLKVIENVTDPKFDDAIEENYATSNLISLDLPPPKSIPSLDIPDSYIPNAQRYLIKRLTNTVRIITLFMDPLLLFNNVVRPTHKLEIESFKMHCRADTYPGQIYSRSNWKFHKLSDIFDTQALKVLTIISWYDHICPDRIYKFDQWAEFPNLEDITLIAVTYNDKKISTLINNCRCLKRLKLDFSFPKRAMHRSSLVCKSIYGHKDHLKFLDIKLNLTFRVVNMDIREFLVAVKIPCNCSLCQERVLKGIFQKKILPHPEDYKIKTIQGFESIDFFNQLFESCLSPYSKAVDRYPSVKTGADNVEDFLGKFNLLNRERSRHFVDLNEQDFYDLYHCLIHSLKADLEPFVQNFRQLEYLVINDISLVIKEDHKTGLRYPVPVFYNRGFKTNFELKSGALTDIEMDQETYGRSLYLN